MQLDKIPICKAATSLIDRDLGDQEIQPDVDSSNVHLFSVYWVYLDLYSGKKGKNGNF